MAGPAWIADIELSLVATAAQRTDLSTGSSRQLDVAWFAGHPRSFRKCRAPSGTAARPCKCALCTAGEIPVRPRDCRIDGSVGRNLPRRRASLKGLRFVEFPARKWTVQVFQCHSRRGMLDFRAFLRGAGEDTGCSTSIVSAPAGRQAIQQIPSSRGLRNLKIRRASNFRVKRQPLPQPLPDVWPNRALMRARRDARLRRSRPPGPRSLRGARAVADCALEIRSWNPVARARSRRQPTAAGRIDFAVPRRRVRPGEIAS